MSSLTAADKREKSFVKMVTEGSEPRAEKDSPKPKNSDRARVLQQIRSDMERLRNQASSAGFALQELKSAMSRSKGNFAIAYQQSADSMRQQFNAIRGEIERMRGIMKNAASSLMMDDADHHEGDHHDQHHDHHEDMAHLNHMEAESHELERISNFTRGRAGLHVLGGHPDLAHAREENNAYTAPIARDLAVMLGAKPQAPDAVDVGPSVDKLAKGFDHFNDEMAAKGVKDIDAQNRINPADGATIRSAGQ